MGQSTPFLNLYLPGGGSTGTNTPDEVMDIDRLNADLQAIDTEAARADSRLDLIESGAGLSNAFIPMVADKAARDALFPTPTDGQRVWRIDADLQEYYDGTKWWFSGGAIVPASSSGGTIAANGSVTFSGVGIVTLVSVFSAKYTSYRILIDLDNSTAGTDGLQLLDGTTPLTTNYFQGGVGVQGSATVVGTHGAATQFPINQSNATIVNSEVIVTQPFGTVRTRAKVSTYAQNGAAQAHTFEGGAFQIDATSHDGIRLMNSGVTMSGKISVQGIA